MKYLNQFIEAEESATTGSDYLENLENHGERVIRPFAVSAAFCPPIARLHALTVDDRLEGKGVRAALLEYATRAEVLG